MPIARALFFLATTGAFALVARSLLFGPVPVAVAAIAMVAYVAVVLAGVFTLRLQMFVDVVTEGPEGARGVALSFDDGPHPVHTIRVLDLLDAAGVKATFFVVGRKAKAHPEIVQAIVDRGHAIGIHSYAHDRLMSIMTPKSAVADLESAIAAVESVTGERPYMFRPPVGHTSPRLAQALRSTRLAVVGWSARGYDGLGGADPEKVAQRVARDLHDRAIVLLHDAAERDDHEPAAIAALPSILATMKDRGLPAVRLDAWVDRPDAVAHPRLAS